MRQGLITAEGNLDVNQGTGWSLLFPMSEKSLGLVSLQVLNTWSREAGLLWKVKMEIVTRCQVYISWTQDGGRMKSEVKGLLDLQRRTYNSGKKYMLDLSYH